MINRVLALALEAQYPAIKMLSDQETEAVTNLPSYIKYLFTAGMSIGFSVVLISLVVAGVMYFLSSISAEARKDAKDRVMGAISGLLILVLTYLIITTINPQLNIFNINKLPETTLPPIEIKQEPGVYFYKDASCADKTAKANTTDVLDLGELKKKVNSINIVQDTNSGDAYISIIYDNPNLWGKCHYVTTSQNSPNQLCKTVENFASSASIYKYDFDTNGDGVYFFRKPCLNEGAYNDIDSLVEQCSNRSGSIREPDPDLPDDAEPVAKSMGGYYHVPGSSIKNIYVGKLDDLTFDSVSEEDQICIKYDKNNKCIGRKSPTLGGDNISSIIINGSYLVLLVYMGPDSNPSGPWTACQEFPTANDVNRLGPRQIKWEVIRNSNSGGVVPNYVVIFPIKMPAIPSPTLPSAPIPTI